jgi:NTE family protein
MDRRWKVFLVAAAGALVAFLDVTIVSVAFPDIEEDFPEASRSSLSWVLSGYNIVFAALLVPAGRIADVVGRRRVFLGGLAAFTAASALCAAAPSAETLVAARILQAAAAAAIIPASLAFVLNEFPITERATAAGLWGAAAAVSAAIGPTLGGALVAAGSWRFVFLVNIPIGVAVLVYGARLLDEGRERGRRLPDPLGVALLIGAAGLLTLGIVKGNDWGWDDPRVLGALAGAAILTPLLLARSRRHPSPVVELRLLRERSVAMGNAGTLLFAAGGFGIILNNVLFLTEVWAYSGVETGLALTPAPLAMAAAAGPAGRAADRYGQRAVAVPGALLFALGTLWLATQSGADPDFLGVWLPGVLLTGTGAGLAYPAFGSAAIAVLKNESFGVGSALNAMFRQIGAALGFALVVAVVGVPSAADAPAAFDAGWAVMGAAALASTVAAIALGRVRADVGEPAARAVAEV